jgi:hypothetical protein
MASRLNKNFIHVIGTKKEITYLVSDLDDLEIDANDIYFAVANDETSQPTFTKTLGNGIEINQEDKKQFIVTIDMADTLSMQAGEYFTQALVQDGNNDWFMVGQGTMTLKNNLRKN